MQDDPGKPAPATPFVLCPPACAEAVRRALPDGCEVVVAGSPEEARAAFAERTRTPAESGAGEIEIDGRTIDLTTLERAVLDVLSRTPGRSFSRAALLREIHGDAAGSVLPRVVDSTVSRLRRKLGPSGWRVETVWGRGYRWNAGDRPAVRPFFQVLRWSAGTLGIVLVATLLVARPRPDEPPPAAEPTAPVVEAPAAVEPAPPVEPVPKPAPAPATRVAAKRAAAPAQMTQVTRSSDRSIKPKNGFEIHVMTAEDRTLSNLARSRGITLAELLAANPQIADPNRIRVGQPVYVPIRAKRTMTP